MQSPAQKAIGTVERGAYNLQISHLMPTNYHNAGFMQGLAIIEATALSESFA